MDRSIWAPLGRPLMFSLMLGLAPFAPEPHIVGKIRWILGGAKGMELMDYADTLMHGAPWIWLIVTFILIIKRNFLGKSS